MEINQEQNRNKRKSELRLKKKKINSRGTALGRGTWRQLTQKEGWRFIWPRDQDKHQLDVTAEKADALLGSALGGTPWKQNLR